MCRHFGGICCFLKQQIPPKFSCLLPKCTELHPQDVKLRLLICLIFDSSVCHRLRYSVLPMNKKFLFQETYCDKGSSVFHRNIATLPLNYTAPLAHDLDVLIVLQLILTLVFPSVFSPFQNIIEFLVASLQL